jgi:hypothetical protein
MKSGSAPDWARSLVLAVCSAAGVAPPNVLRWRRAAREASSGLASRRGGSIAVTAGTDPADARHTLLHELAHWLTPEASSRRAGRRSRIVHHGAAFYATALPLFARHADGIEATLRREASRYPSVLRHAAAAGIGAAAMLAAERRGARARRRSAGLGTWRLLVPEHPVTLVRTGRWDACATCGHRLVGRTLARAARRGRRERHALWTRSSGEAAAGPLAGNAVG